MRTFARMENTLLLNDDWVGLSTDAQSLYVTLLIHPNLSMCGVTDWFPKRLSHYSAMNVKDVIAAGRELEGAGFVVIDEETDEVMIRSFLRHDVPLKSPKTAVSVDKAYCAVVSRKLRKAIVHEAIRLRAENPDWSGWAKVPILISGMNAFEHAESVPERYPDRVSDTPSDTVSDRVSDTVSATVSDTVSDTVSNTPSSQSEYGTSIFGINQNPESIIHNPESKGSNKRTKQGKPTKTTTTRSQSSRKHRAVKVSEQSDATTGETERIPTSSPNPSPAPAPDEIEVVQGELVPTDGVPAEPTPTTGEDRRALLPGEKDLGPRPKNVDDWRPLERQVAKCSRLGKDPTCEAQKFRNYASYRAKPYKNFDRAFDNWLIRIEEEQARRSKSQMNQDLNMRMVMQAAQRDGNLPTANGFSEEDFR